MLWNFETYVSCKLKNVFLPSMKQSPAISNIKTEKNKQNNVYHSLFDLQLKMWELRR